MFQTGEFEFALPANGIVFGPGTARSVGSRAKTIGARRVLVMTDIHVRRVGHLDLVEESLRSAGLDVGVFDGVSTEPTFPAVEASVAFCRSGEYDHIVALGGGSTLDSAKATSLLVGNGGHFMDYLSPGATGGSQRGPGVIAMATTSGTGADMTRGAGAIDPETGTKYWASGQHSRPVLAICDPELTRTMPPHVTAATGTDALCQAIESYTNRKYSPMADTLNLEAVRIIGRHLRVAVANGDDMEARSAMMYAASCLVGVGFGNGGLHAIHPIAQLFGDRYRVPHGLSLGLLMPYVLEFSQNGCIERLGQVAEALGEDISLRSPRAAADRGIAAIRQILEDIGTFKPLREFGATESDLAKLAEEYNDRPPGRLAYNPIFPRPIRSSDDVLSIFTRAL
jgi:alcohol dehydrogenase